MTDRKEFEAVKVISESFWNGVKSRLDKLELKEGLGNSDTQVLLRAVWILHCEIEGLEKRLKK